MARNLNIPHKTPNDLLTADEFNTLVVAVEASAVTRADLQVDNVDNTRDINKPISIATQAALNNKQNNLGYTPENPNNKVVDLATPNHTTYPTSLAVSNAIFNSGVVVTDASSTIKGKIALTGDLGGTADAPTVPGLAAKQDILPVGTSTQYFKGDKTLGTLSTDIVAEGATNKYLTSTERNKLNGISAGATVNDTDVNLKNRLNHTGTQSADTITDGTTNKVYSAAEKTKLAGVAVGATVNSPDATLLARANHTGTESADNLIDGTTNKVYTATEKTKLAGVAVGATVNDSDVNLKNRLNHTGTQSADTITDGTTNKVFTAANQTKLAGIATAATANSTDATLRDRSTHTGTQAQSTIVSLTTDLASKQATLVSNSNIKTVGGTSVLGAGDIPFPTTNITDKFFPNEVSEELYATGDTRLKIQGLRSTELMHLLRMWGSNIVTETAIIRLEDTATSVLTTGKSVYMWAYIDKSITLASLSIFMRTAGVYTATGYNGLGVYSFDPTTKVATKIAQTADTPNLWTAALGYVTVPLVTPVAVTPGWYLFSCRWEASATTTAPAIAGKSLASSVMSPMDSFPWFIVRNTANETTIDMSTASASGGIMFWIGGIKS